MKWPLVGRDRELGFASGLLSDGAAGGVVVAGAAGVGKTRLAVELSRIAELRDCAVEWVRATQSAASIPLGAFASLLPPTGDAPAGGAELLARARGALVERARGRRLVLCVDDGHLLDAGSASLVHQLVAAGEAFAVVTVRHGERVPDAVRALWKDELCAFVELEVLSRGDIERLLEEVLGGPLDGRSTSALWELTRGNALFLRELVLYGIDRGVLSEAGGIWRWRGEVAAGTRLAALVGSRLESLGSSEHSVLEVVAVGAPLEVGLLEPEEVAALGVLEAQGMVERAPDSRRRCVDLAHPLHGEVVRGHLGRTRLEAIQRRLAYAVQARGGQGRGDVPRLAMLGGEEEPRGGDERPAPDGLRRPPDRRRHDRLPGGRLARVGAAVAPPQRKHDERRDGIHADPAVEDHRADQRRVAVIEAVPVDDRCDEHERREERRAEDAGGRGVILPGQERAQEEVRARAVARAEEDRREVRLDRPGPGVGGAVRQAPEDHQRRHEDEEDDEARPARGA